MRAPTLSEDRLWSGPHRRVVAGIFSLAFLVAFESLAVATIMPVVADELGGLRLYALSFAAPIALGVVSMTLAGPLMDRHGPGAAVRGGVAVFVAGLLVAGVAPSMAVFLLGRGVQGLGSGFVTVGLYVVIGGTFHDVMRPRVFTVLTSAWVLPALVGPLLAGAVVHAVGWRWVFLGVPVLAIGSLLMLGRAMAQIHGDLSIVIDRRRVRRAAVVAAGVLAVSWAGQREAGWWPLALAAGLVATVTFAPRLAPAGTWKGRRGLPSVVATRSLLAAAFVGAETYVPLSLVEHRGLSVGEAGLLLTAAAVTWFSGSWLAAHLAVLASRPRRVRVGVTCVLVGILSGPLTLVDAVPVAVVAVVWSLGGLGMGLAATTLGVLVLEHSAPGEQGVNSASAQTSDAVVQSLVLAIGSVVFAIVLTVDEHAAYVLVFGLAGIVAAAAVLMSTRVSSASG